MGLEELEPGNTNRAKATSVNAFVRFLKAENVSLDYVKDCILSDGVGQTFVAVMDKFGMHLAFHEGKQGKPLARHSVMQYYRQAKNWLLEQFPLQRAAIDSRLLQMGRTLEKHCIKREAGGFVKKAMACTKSDLRRMVLYLYSNATSSSDYQDAALLCLLWYLFGRASDLTLLRKQNVSISAGDVFFVRFIRMKTSEEQGLSLFSDEDFSTRPLLAIALALLTQAAPCAALLNHLPEFHKAAAVAVAPATPLLDNLSDPSGASGFETTTAAAPDGSGGIHSCVNRLLDRVGKLAGVDSQLTSHSFRRGGAQHANGSSALSAQWIFDRGAWNITTTSKAFAYVFNTPSEDHKVAKVLSDRDVDATALLLDTTAFDTETQTKISAVRARLFNTCHKLGNAQYNANDRVLDVLTAYLICHYPALKRLNPDGVAVKRLEAGVTESNCSLGELLSWSMHLASMPYTCATSEAKPSNATEDHQLIRHQAAVIDQLLELNKRLDKRMNAMEAILTKRPLQDTTQQNQQDNTDIRQPVKRRKTAAVTHLKVVWFAWYAEEPRIWSTQDAKQKKSDAKMLAAFMKLFLDTGFALNERASSYRDGVHAVGSAAEKNLQTFLGARGISSIGSSSVLKHMRHLYKAGEFNSKILRYRQLILAGQIIDPAPAFTQNILELATPDTQHNTFVLRRRHKPTTTAPANPNSSKREFKSLCIELAKTRNFRITDEAMRHLRLAMVQTAETRGHLPETLLVVFVALAERKKRRIELDDVREWLSPRPTDTERSTDAEDDPKGELVHAVRKVLNRVRVDGKMYFLVDWEPTLEPRANLPQTLVAAFNREHRALVRRTYIEDEAVEDNSLNITEQ